VPVKRDTGASGDGTSAGIDSLLTPSETEPISLFESATACPSVFGTATRRQLEFSCRGDRVPCTVVRPAGDQSVPLVLIQAEPHPESLATCARWVSSGCAIATIDLPLHASRHSEKLSENLTASIARTSTGEALDSTSELLYREFMRQAILEVRRTLAVLAGLDDIDASRLAFAGRGVGAWVGAIACALETRVSAAALAEIGSNRGPTELELGGWLPRLAPRPVLLLNTDGPIGEACEPEAVWDRMWSFLSEPLLG
jgi:dienelactone hydrolase